MFIRVIDYAANEGGGIRFVSELLRSLISYGLARYEVVSYGAALGRYQQAFNRMELVIPTQNVPPSQVWRNEPPRRHWGIPGTGRLSLLLGAGEDWYFRVPKSVLRDCDLVWLPWLHSHQFARRFSSKIVATFHDTIAIEFLGNWPESHRKMEEKLTLRHLSSSASIVVDSYSTASSLLRLYGVPERRLQIVRLSGDHSLGRSQGELPRQWIWSSKPFVICPTNLSSHKNVDGLFRAFALWRNRIPLVLTGESTDLVESDKRGVRLRNLANNLGLSIGKDVLPLGYLDDTTYFTLLLKAWALIMPTLAEGCGIPLLEALHLGLPVVASDIPALREQAMFLGAEVSWFNPRDPTSIAYCLEELAAKYATLKLQAIEQVQNLRNRSWNDVAEEYLRIFRCKRDCEKNRKSGEQMADRMCQAPPH